MKTLDELLASGVSGRRVIVRADLNVPLSGQTITDDGRIRAVLPTVRRLREAGARVILISHLGRPKGVPDEKYSLKPVSARLAELIGAPVAAATDTIGPSAAEAVNSLSDGDVALLENLRFDPRETSKDAGEREALAAELASFGDVYVDDAFGAVHRKHASVYELAQRLPAYGGGLVIAEVEVLKRLTDEVARPYVVVLGGAKVSDKLGVIKALLPKVDKLLIGGGMAFTFLAAQGHSVGQSLLESDQIDTARQLLADAGDKIALPTDVVVAADLAADAETRTVTVDAIGEQDKGLDIGPETVEAFSAVVKAAATVFWNGPMGVFEFAPFAAGTRGVGSAIAGLASKSALTVVGGGDSAAAVRLLDLDEKAFDHISTGGGASLEYLEGKTLPGLAALEG